jgi:hypothetical protein
VPPLPMGWITKIHHKSSCDTPSHHRLVGMLSAYSQIGILHLSTSAGSRSILWKLLTGSAMCVSSLRTKRWIRIY